jgi:hypothetical protein
MSDWCSIQSCQLAITNKCGGLSDLLRSGVITPQISDITRASAQGVMMPQADSGGEKSQGASNRGAWIQFSGAVLAAFIVAGIGLAAVFIAGRSSSTTNGPYAPSPSPTGLSPSPRKPSPLPTALNVFGHAEISNVISAAHSSCIGDTVKVAIAVSSPASVSRELWLMAIVITGKPNPHPVYYAKQELTNAVGRQMATIQFIGARVGSMRNLVIVSSPPSSFSWLKQNRANDGNPAWDIKRVTRHGVSEISNQYQVTQQC